jgi:hypothetical protein
MVPPNQCEYERSDVAGWGLVVAGSDMVMEQGKIHEVMSLDRPRQTNLGDKATGGKPLGMRNVV